jgi:hypothetical protein
MKPKVVLLDGASLLKSPEGKIIGEAPAAIMVFRKDRRSGNGVVSFFITVWKEVFSSSSAKDSMRKSNYRK